MGAARRRQEERREGDRDPRQDRLRLRVAEAGVELQQDRAPIGRQDQAGVESAAEGHAPAGQLRQRGAVEAGHDLPDEPVVHVGERRVGAHAAGVGPAVAVTQPLVVAGGGQGQGEPAVAEGNHARLRTVQALLDDHPRGTVGLVTGGEDCCQRLVRLREVVTDRDPLAGREAVGLDHHAAAGCREGRGVGAGGPQGTERAAAGHGDAGGRGDRVAEGLAALDPGRGRRRPEDRDSRARRGVGHARREGRLRPDDDEVRPQGSGRGSHRGRVGGAHAGVDAHARDGRQGGAPRHGQDLLDPVLGGEPPGESMLATSSADEEDPPRDGERLAHPAAVPADPGAGRPGASGRSWRTTVWDRSGPTETSRMGTPASASRALT